MRAKITKRSKKDGTMVTIPLEQLKDGDGTYLLEGSDDFVGNEVTVVIDDVPTVCTLVRPDKHGFPTAMTTRALPRHIRLPRVGRPVYADISEIR